MDKKKGRSVKKHRKVSVEKERGLQKRTAKPIIPAGLPREKTGKGSKKSRAVRPAVREGRPKPPRRADVADAVPSPAALPKRGSKPVAPKNPYAMTVEQQVEALRLANDQEGWGIAEKVFARLSKTAPAWPEGEQAYRSLRVRFGEGSEGVWQTYRRHVDRIRSVFDHSPYLELERGEWLPHRHARNPVGRPRLLNGDATHVPVVEWVTSDLAAHRERESITAVRGPRSLADELLVIAWMFPDAIRAIDYDVRPALCAAGYAVDIPEYAQESGPWAFVVMVSYWKSRGHPIVHALERNYAGPGSAVPVLLSAAKT